MVLAWQPSERIHIQGVKTILYPKNEQSHNRLPKSGSWYLPSPTYQHFIKGCSLNLGIKFVLQVKSYQAAKGSLWKSPRVVGSSIVLFLKSLLVAC